MNTFDYIRLAMLVQHELEQYHVNPRITHDAVEAGHSSILLRSCGRWIDKNPYCQRKVSLVDVSGELRDVALRMSKGWIHIAISEDPRAIDQAEQDEIGCRIAGRALESWQEAQEGKARTLARPPGNRETEPLYRRPKRRSILSPRDAERREGMASPSLADAVPSSAGHLGVW